MFPSYFRIVAFRRHDLPTPGFRSGSRDPPSPGSCSIFFAMVEAPGSAMPMPLRFCKSRTYHDPLHGAITLDGGDPAEALMIRLIDTPAFQRLRRIRQLDAASFTFHGAEGSRFTHSVGVLHTARRLFDKLAKQHPSLKSYRALVLASALLHDVGHSPFSHAGEEMFGCHHEHWTSRIVAEDSHINGLLSSFDPALPEQMQQVIAKKFSLPLVGQIVSSQLDCDRLDYLLRDSLLTGAQYGRLDLDRIITVMDYDPETGSLKITARKGLGPIEHYLVVRYFMYTQVYQHPKSLAARYVQNRLFYRARLLYQAGELPLDPILSAWMTDAVDDLPLDLYLAADDIMFTYPLRFWSQGSLGQVVDPILQDLSRRYLERDLFKGLNISYLDGSQRDEVVQKLRQRVAADGLDPIYYVGLCSSRIQGYSLYEQGIQLHTERGPREIAELSGLVKALVDTRPQDWLIFPHHYKDWVQTLL